MIAFVEMMEKIFAHFGVEDAAAVVTMLKEFLEKIFAPKEEA